MREPKDKEVKKYFQPICQNGSGIQAQSFLISTRTSYDLGIPPSLAY